MASQIEIANMALDIIGTRSTVSSLSEGSIEANAISRHWENARDCVLRAAHWNFAKKQQALTLIADATAGDTVPQPYLYEYAYPSDCVLMRMIVPLIQTTSEVPVDTVTSSAPMTAYGPPVNFTIATDVDSLGNPIQVILTNQKNAVGIWTFRNTNTQMYDALFVNALAAYLGSRVCQALTGDKNMLKMAFEMATNFVTQAQRFNGNEGLTILDITPDWMRVRGYLSDWTWPSGGMYTYGPQALQLFG